MFHVTNTACVIELKNTELSFGSGTFLEIAGQSQWGNTESNGGQAEFAGTVFILRIIQIAADLCPDGCSIPASVGLLVAIQA